MKYAMGLKNVQYAISNDTAVRLLDFVEHPNQPTPTNEDGVVALTRRARGIARRRATRDARATLSRGETRRSEKFARRETARARTRRDRATDARENVNRVAHPGDGSRRRARVFGSRRAVSGARGVLRGETRRSEKFARRETARARTRRDRATDARENVNRVAHRGDGSRRRARVFGSRRAARDERCARGVARRNASI